MKVFTCASVSAVLIVLAFPSDLGAQYARPIAVTARVSQPTHSADSSQVATRPAKTPYILGGAVVGGFVTAVAFALGSDSSSEGHLDGLVAVIGTVVGAAVGAGVGWAVYEVRH